MFVRFIVLARNPRRASGLFRGRPADFVDDNDVPSWLRTAIAAEYAWFNKHLKVPYHQGASRSSIAGGICWFRPEARVHKAHARQLAWLIAEAGSPTEMITTRDVGNIIYRDDVQVVAKPTGGTRLSK